MATDWTLAAGLEAFGEYMAAWGTAPGMVSRRAPGSWLLLSGLQVADLNMAGVLAGDGARAAVEDAAEAIDELGVPALVLLEDAAPVAAQLDAAGLTVVADMPIMLCGPTPFDGAAGVEVAAARTPDELDAGVEMMSTAFSLDLEACRMVYDARCIEPDWPVQVWLARLDGDVQGSGTSILGENSVGVFSMSTPAAFANRGVGRSVLAAIHSYGRAAGRTDFILGATEAGFPLYEKVGYGTLGRVAIAASGASTQFPAH